MTYQPSMRLRAAAVLASLSLLLSGCFVSPGKFTSELTLLEDDQFTYTYEGEVYFLALSEWVQEQQQRTRPEFEPYCYNANEPEAAADVMEGAAAEAPEEEAEVAVEAAADDSVEVAVDVASESYGRRDCTAEEEAEQRAEWEERQAARRERDKQQAEEISKFLGGVDPTDPEAEAQLAKILSRQKGFDRVVAKGNGLFDVSYSISGTLSHNYMFPMLEDFPTTNPFVQLFLREGDLVRVNAIGFAPRSVTSPMMPLMAAGGGFGGGRSDEFEALESIPPVEGTFTIITTGDIRANNTDEGPSMVDGRKRLTWTINSFTKATPTALIAMPR